MVPVIAISDSMAPTIRQRAEEKGVPLTIAQLGPDGTLAQPVDGLDGVLTSNLSVAQVRKLLQDHQSVRWVAAQNAGVDALMLPEVLERNITVTRVRHVHDTYVAEFSMALLLAAAKGVRDIVLAKERHEWLTFQPALVAGKTVSIVGYGEIGLAVAKRAKAFEMRVLGVRTRPKPDGVADEVWGADRLEEALRQADFALLVVPGGADRQHLIGERQLRLLRKEAFLINVGRGEVLDEAAIDRVLREEGFAGALIDTFSVEPLPQNSPLWTNPRVIIAAHIAGIRSGAPRPAVIDQIVDNIGRFGRGEPLMNAVDVSRGY